MPPPCSTAAYAIARVVDVGLQPRRGGPDRLRDRPHLIGASAADGDARAPASQVRGRAGAEARPTTGDDDGRAFYGSQRWFPFCVGSPLATPRRGDPWQGRRCGRGSTPHRWPRRQQAGWTTVSVPLWVAHFVATFAPHVPVRREGQPVVGVDDLGYSLLVGLLAQAPCRRRVALRFSASRRGGAPKRRPYSRLNCDGLS